MNTQRIPNKYRKSKQTGVKEAIQEDKNKRKRSVVNVDKTLKTKIYTSMSLKGSASKHE